MKTATFPPLRVEPALRQAAEEVLHEGETLSGFVEASVRAQIEQRRAQAEFLARGLASCDRARQGAGYVPTDEVVERLQAKLALAKRKRR